MGEYAKDEAAALQDMVAAARRDGSQHVTELQVLAEELAAALGSESDGVAPNWMARLRGRPRSSITTVATSGARCRSRGDARGAGGCKATRGGVACALAAVRRRRRGRLAPVDSGEPPPDGRRRRAPRGERAWRGSIGSPRARRRTAPASRARGTSSRHLLARAILFPPRAPRLQTRCQIEARPPRGPALLYQWFEGERRRRRNAGRRLSGAAAWASDIKGRDYLGWNSLPKPNRLKTRFAPIFAEWVRGRPASTGSTAASSPPAGHVEDIAGRALADLRPRHRDPRLQQLGMQINLGPRGRRTRVLPIRQGKTYLTRLSSRQHCWLRSWW